MVHACNPRIGKVEGRESWVRGLSYIVKLWIQISEKEKEEKGDGKGKREKEREKQSIRKERENRS